MSGTEEGRPEWCKMGAQWAATNSIVWGISRQPAPSGRSISSKESENNVCLWGKNVAEIKGTYDCNGWHCLQYSKGPHMCVPELSHTAILQDIIPDTLPSDDSTAVVEKELCSCTCPGDQLSPAGCTTSCSCPSEMLANGLNQSGAGRLPNTSCAVCTAFHLPICVFSTLIPRYAEIWLPQERSCASCHILQRRVRGMKSLHHMQQWNYQSKEGPFLYQTNRKSLASN